MQKKAAIQKIFRQAAINLAACLTLVRQVVVPAALGALEVVSASVCTAVTALLLAMESLAVMEPVVAAMSPSVGGCSPEQSALSVTAAA